MLVRHKHIFDLNYFALFYIKSKVITYEIRLVRKKYKKISKFV